MSALRIPRLRIAARHRQAALAIVAAFALAHAGSSLRAEEELPLLLDEKFDHGADRWQPTDPAAWRATIGPGKSAVFSIVAQSNYNPPHRSPLNFALLKGVHVGDFVLTADMQSTGREAAHRDMCIIFGYQDPAHFYYVHLAKSADRNANQIFIVNGADRRKISTKTSQGTKWDDNWHKVKVVRRQGGASGTESEIAVYFDDMNEPVMTASDKTIPGGQVGIGSFDDTGNFDNITLHGSEAAAVSSN